MNELTFMHFLHISVCLKSIKTFIGWGLHSARKWTIVLDKLLTIMVGHFFSDHSPILHRGVSFFLSINNKVHNDAFLNNTARQWLGDYGYYLNQLKGLKNIQEQGQNILFQKLFWPFTVWINCCSDLKFFCKFEAEA